ncbi:GlsB/YeaQ/YmgE family stress response membrane protein [Macrococcus psychrotolerans]|uniref:GlsB/YeaQ/YmgE family stress response membrane protein n=1 Tax=Macrococcus psychrotolerans TaxID=3039389 RepID=A0AAT9P7E2_9STAP|nr:MULTISPECIES: GlsB/YeaQ/YmgE family stress response membrane protein [Macrococcus]QYA33320.1 GlsB/YeaQ/YmgE family stress response membrane protein [Macrococcus sp. 19Msa1099]QYA38134.1 GlsB/YeaQ/YmgE family stress response membrane protein [Macrococcus caseolyticus]QYA76841.1 GlsB/YeaQ/YmgE family stress response membrane protein [Macrococcus caseolyticus]
MFGFILMLIMGGLIGWIAGMIMGTDIPGGKIGNIIAGLLGASVGGKLLGTWGPEMWGVYVLPALVGTILLIAIVSIVLQLMHKRR